MTPSVDNGTLPSLPPVGCGATLPSRTDAAHLDDPSETAFVTRLRRGDELAFEQLVRMEGPRLLAVARRFLRREQDAQDAVQDAFVAAFRALPTFEGNSRISTWLHRIVINVALMRIRSSRRRPEASIDDFLPQFLEDGHHAAEFQEWRLPSDVRLLREELRERIRQAIDRLPDSYRTVLLLRDIEQLDTDEAARALGTTPNAVKIRLHRARQALRALLEPEFRR
jgi:RNA polymerase sigma-70 factor (ECF subfamily)